MASFIMQMIVTLMLFVFVDAIDQWFLDALQSAAKKEKVKVDIGIRNDYLLQDCGGTSLKKSFPDLDYALMGYHILKGYPMAQGHDPGFTHPIFKADYSEGRQTDDCKFSIPHGYTIIPDVSCQTSFSSETIESSQQLKENMAISAKASGGGWGVSFSASASYQKASESLQRSKKVMVISRATCQYYFARLDEVNPPPFDDSFLEWVTRLNNSTSENEDFIDFITYYGTHFMKTVVFGARYMYEHSMTKSTLEEVEKSSTSVEASLGYSGFGVNAGASFGYSQGKEEASSKLRQNVETKIISVGSPPPENGDTLKWASSVKETPVPYRYEMASIEELFNSQYLKRYEGIDGEKLRARFNYIRMTYGKEILRRALKRVCRVFNSAYQLPPKYSLQGYTVEINATSNQECIEACLASKDCFGMTFGLARSPNVCYMYSECGTLDSNCTNTFDAERKSEDANSFSLLFPNKLQVKSGAFKEESVPTQLIINGIRISWYNTGCNKMRSQKKCIDKCLDRDWCVVVNYNSYGNCCMLNEVQLAASDVTTTDGATIFVKKC